MQRTREVLELAITGPQFPSQLLIQLCWLQIVKLLSMQQPPIKILKALRQDRIRPRHSLYACSNTMNNGHVDPHRHNYTPQSKQMLSPNTLQELISKTTHMFGNGDGYKLSRDVILLEGNLTWKLQKAWSLLFENWLSLQVIGQILLDQS